MTGSFSDDLVLSQPERDELGTQAISIFGTRGSGKTYLAGRFCECLYMNQNPFVVIDLVGNLWSLRVGEKGKGSAIPVIVLGGRHGDLPLPATSGAAVADFAWNGGKALRSLVLDLSEFEDEETEMLRFAIDFGQRFYLLARKYQQVCTLVLEEAHSLVPEQPQSKLAQKCRNIYRRHVRVGRNFGQGTVISSQRPQAVDKETVNLSEVLLVGRLVGKHERDRVRQWTRDVSDDATKLVDELPKLKTGEFFLFSPSWLGTFRKIVISKRFTFDASATPKLRKERGIVDPTVPRLEANTLATLRASFVEAAAKADNDDPSRLREQLARAREEIVGLKALGDVRRDTEGSEIATLKGDVVRLESTLLYLKGGLERIGHDAEGLLQHAMGMKTHEQTLGQPSRPTPLEQVEAVAAKLVREKTTRVTRTTETHETHETTSLDYAGELLSVIATHGPIMAKQIAVLAGKSRRSSTFDQKLAELVREGYVTRERGVYAPTPAGLRKAPALTLPTGPRLVDYWLRKVTPYQAKLLGVVARSSPNAVPYELLAEQAGVSRTSSTFDEAIAKLVALNIFDRSNKSVRLGAALRSLNPGESSCKSTS